MLFRLSRRQAQGKAPFSGVEPTNQPTNQSAALNGTPRLRKRAAGMENGPSGVGVLAVEEEERRRRTTTGTVRERVIAYTQRRERDVGVVACTHTHAHYPLKTQIVPLVLK